jgi:hypothetical protein
MDPAAAALPMPGEMPTATPASQLAVNMIPGAEAL